MKRMTTILCCFMFMCAGAFLALDKFEVPGYKTALASPAIQYPLLGKLPLDLQLDLEKRHKADTVFMRDTVYKDTGSVVSTTKYVKVPQRKHTTDTLIEVMPIPGPIHSVLVNNSSAGDREEYTPVVLPSPKRRSVSLTVDGRVVYSTENDIHSTEDLQ